MFKVLLIYGFIGFCTAATLFQIATNSEENKECLHPDEIWGSVDGTKFYFCIPDTDIVIEQSCEPDTFFIRNATTCGCVPLSYVEPECVTLEEVKPCTGKNVFQPQPAPNPSDYYFCTMEGAEPKLVPCPTGKAFYKQNGYLGCFDWASWRDLRGCPQ